MMVKLTRLTHKIAIQLHLMAVSCTICSSRSRRPVRKLLDTHSYFPSIQSNIIHLRVLLLLLVLLLLETKVVPVLN